MTAVITSQKFQQRMFEKIRDQMGDLMSDEDLKKIVEAAIDKAFFENRIVADKYGRESVREPELVEKMRELMRPAVEKAAGEWFRKNEDAVVAMLDQAIGRGITGVVARYFDSVMQQNMYDLKTSLENALRNAG